MKKKIQGKINEVIETIIAKKPEDITYNEYRILDCKYSQLKWEEEQVEKSKDLKELWLRTLGDSCCGFGGMTPMLPEPSEDK